MFVHAFVQLKKYEDRKKSAPQSASANECFGLEKIDFVEKNKL
jgi:hypothetical protein